MRRQKAYLFLPDDPRLRRYAAELAESRRHSLRKRSRGATRTDPPPTSPMRSRWATRSR